MHIKKIITKFLACTLATIVMMSAFVIMGSVTKTDVASALVWSYDTNGTASNDDDTVFFKSDVNDAAKDTPIINCLGYFITIYDKYQESKGTIFITNTTNGHSYYHYTDGQNDGVSIPVADIKNKINSEYAGTETKEDMLRALSSTFYMVLDSLITPSVKGNSNSCAYTLKSTNVTSKEVLTAYTHLLNDPSATANGSDFWAPLAIQRNRGSSSKYTSSYFCLSASSSIFADSTRISEIGFSPSFSSSLYISTGTVRAATEVRVMHNPIYEKIFLWLQSLISIKPQGFIFLSKKKRPEKIESFNFI